MGRLIIAGGNVLDPSAQRFIPNTTVVLEDDTITLVEPGEVTALPDDEVHSAEDRWVIPGLIDAHFHLVSRSREEVDDRLVAISTIEGVVTAEEVLRAGVTCVRDCGCRHHGIHELAAAFGHLIPGPRAFVAGRNPTGTDAPAHWRNVIASGVDGVRAAVRAELDQGADFIKLVLAHAGDPSDWGSVEQFLSEEEMRAAVEEAHDRGALVGAHTEGYEVAAAAVRAGIDVLDHAPLISEETVALMVERGTVYVPTVWGFSDDSGIDLDKLPPAQANAIRYWRAKHRESVASAFGAGVTIAAGSDAAGSLPAADVLLREMDALSRCGLDNTEVLRAATTAAAISLGQSGRLGTIAPGAVADLVVLTENPHGSLSTLSSPEMVISRGRLVGRQWRREHAAATAATTERW